MSSRCPEALLLALTLLAGCEREARRFREAPPAATTTGALAMSGLRPGPPVPDSTVASAYQDNAWAISEGQILYGSFNCKGCHAMGGGGIGPPLMDDEWIYGSDPGNIFATIVQGRPNGMPAYGGRLGAAEVWKLVAYVRSMSGLVRNDAAPGRQDAMRVKEPEMSTPRREPRASNTPRGEPR
jgi:cytochrome c oxidase cbb3-type subunit III